MQINWGDAPSWVMAVTAILGVWFGYKQLKGLVTTLEMNVKTLQMNVAALTMNRLATVLQLETDLNDRKFRMAELSGRLQSERAKAKPNPKLITAIENTLNASKEHYLNAVDRLAYCIMKDYFPERDWKVEYRDYISAILSSPAFAQYFLANTEFRNLYDLNAKWKREN